MVDIKASLTKQYGPLPLWGWGLVGIGSWFAYQHIWKNKPNQDSSTVGYSTVATLPPPNLSGYSDLNSYSYSPPSAFPMAVDNPVPTSGSQGGPFLPGITPAVAPPVSTEFQGNLVDPTTGRPIFSGPNGEGGFAYTPGAPVPAGRMTYQMPDGRWATYYPNTYVQNGNRIALGLAPVSYATSVAPGANPASVSSLLGMTA